MRHGERSSSARFEIRSGTPVATLTHHLGSVDTLSLAPRVGVVGCISIKTGLFHHGHALIPIRSVVDASEELVRVYLTDDEWAAFRASPDALNGYAGDFAPIRSGNRVLCLDGEACTLEIVLIDAPSRTATGLVVCYDAPAGPQAIVPIELLGDIRADGIVVDLKGDELASLPEYKADDQITADVQNVLWYRSNIEHADLEYVEVRTTDGIVESSGLTRTDRARSEIERTATAVRGVLGIHNHIQSGEAIAKANDPALYLGDARPPWAARGQA